MKISKFCTVACSYAVTVTCDGPGARSVTCRWAQHCSKLRMKDYSAGYNQAGLNLLVGPALAGTTRHLHIYHHSRNQTRGLSFATVLICIGLCYTAVECVTFQDIQLL